MSRQEVAKWCNVQATGCQMMQHRGIQQTKHDGRQSKSMKEPDDSWSQYCTFCGAQSDAQTCNCVVCGILPSFIHWHSAAHHSRSITVPSVCARRELWLLMTRWQEWWLAWPPWTSCSTWNCSWWRDKHLSLNSHQLRNQSLSGNNLAHSISWKKC